MSPKTQTKIDPNQGELISFMPQAGIEVVADVYSEDCLSVDLLERSKHLGNALVSLGSASKLTGLEIASGTPILRGQLERRYDDVDALTGKSYDARQKHLASAKREFARASGHHKLVKANPNDEERIKRESRADYSDFIATFADSSGAKNRREMQKTLAKQQELLSQNRSRGRVE